MSMGMKTYRGKIEVKADGEQGEFSAVFATLNVIDYDDDVTLPGAFGSQRVLIETWNHNYQAPPVGKGMITEQGDQAIVNGKFFLDTDAGREHYIVVKNLEDMQEWSYTFRITDADEGVFEGMPVRFLRRLEVIGVSPVTEGAGIDTHTVAIKSAEDSGAGDSAGGDGAGDGEGEAGDGDGKPSGVSPRDVQVQIDILKAQL